MLGLYVRRFRMVSAAVLRSQTASARLTVLRFPAITDGGVHAVEPPR